MKQTIDDSYDFINLLIKKKFDIIYIQETKENTKTLYSYFVKLNYTNKSENESINFSPYSSYLIVDLLCLFAYLLVVLWLNNNINTRTES